MAAMLVTAPSSIGVAKRHIVTVMLFIGMAVAYTMRVNMSMAIVRMVNQTAVLSGHRDAASECPYKNITPSEPKEDGKYTWNMEEQASVTTAFYYGYVLTQIPLGILAKKYGAKWFLGVGMLINSIFGLLVPIAAEWGRAGLIAIRVIQGLGEGPVVPCTHALLAKWIPPNERSRSGALVYAGSQLGSVISIFVTGWLSSLSILDGWPLAFYLFGTISLVWTVLYLYLVEEDPRTHPTISEEEKNYILSSVYGNTDEKPAPVPWKAIFTSLPFYAILVAHMGFNYGYDDKLSELPSYMKQVLNADTKSNAIYSSLPFLVMWLLSMAASVVADWFISRGYSKTIVRKVANSIGMFGPAVGLIIASYSGCNLYLTLAMITIGIGLNGFCYSGFKISHLDVSPRFAGILMSFTNCMANIAGLIAPKVTAAITNNKPTQAAWRNAFFVEAGVYFATGVFYLVFGSCERQPWDQPPDQLDYSFTSRR